MARKALAALRTRIRFPSLNQQSTNYCWANAPIQGMHYLAALAGLPHVDLSPASVAAPIRRYQNQGGWGSEACEYLAQHGACEQSLWPANAINRALDNERSQANRRRHLLVEFYEVEPRNFEALVTALLAGFVVACGFNWWGHEVLALDPVISGGRVVVDFDNSWGPAWGDEGRVLLSEQKAAPDEGIAMRVRSPWSELQAAA